MPASLDEENINNYIYKFWSLFFSYPNHSNYWICKVFLTLMCYHETRCQKPGAIVWCSLNLLHQKVRKMCCYFPNFINKMKPMLPKSELGKDINPFVFYCSSSAGSKSNSSASYWFSRSHHITQSRLFSISSLHNLKADFKTLLIVWFVCRRMRVNEAAERSEGHRHNVQRSEIWLHPHSEQTADTFCYLLTQSIYTMIY